MKSTSGFNTSPVLPSIIRSPSITIFFWSSSQASFLIVSSINFWSYTFLSMTYWFRSSFKHAIQTGLSGPKIISLYFVMVSLIAFSSSSFVFIQFRRSIFNFLQVLTATSCSFIISIVTLKQVTKVFHVSFYTTKYPSSSLNMLHCWLSTSVYSHSSTYTWRW